VPASIRRPKKAVQSFHTLSRLDQASTALHALAETFSDSLLALTTRLLSKSQRIPRMRVFHEALSQRNGPASKQIKRAGHYQWPYMADSTACGKCT
jgi:hypothetical protein